jgi:hypothetical protein
MEGCIRLRRHSKYSTMVWEDLCPLKDFHSFLTLFRDVVIKLILSLVDTSLSSQAWRTSLSQTRQGRRGSRVGNTGCSLPRTMLLCPNTGTSPPILVTQIRSFCRFRSRVVWFRTTRCCILGRVRGRRWRGFEGVLLGAKKRGGYLGESNKDSVGRRTVDVG